MSMTKSEEFERELYMAARKWIDADSMKHILAAKAVGCGLVKDTDEAYKMWETVLGEAQDDMIIEEMARRDLAED